MQLARVAAILVHRPDLRPSRASGSKDQCAAVRRICRPVVAPARLSQAHRIARDYGSAHWFRALRQSCKERGCGRTARSCEKLSPVHGVAPVGKVGWQPALLQRKKAGNDPGLFLLTSPRLRGEVGLRSNPGEGDSPRIPMLRQPLTPTL